MPANECIPFAEPGLTKTVKAGSAITGKRFVKITAVRTGGGAGGLSTDVLNVPVAGPCGVAGEAALGVAKNDIASGALGGVFLAGNGIILPITCGANITAGQEVQTDSTGKAIPWVVPTAHDGVALTVVKALGYAIDSALSGADCEIKLY